MLGKKSEFIYTVRPQPCAVSSHTKPKPTPATANPYSAWTWSIRKHMGILIVTTSGWRTLLLFFFVTSHVRAIFEAKVHYFYKVLHDLASAGLSTSLLLLSPMPSKPWPSYVMCGFPNVPFLSGVCVLGSFLAKNNIRRAKKCPRVA